MAEPGVIPSEQMYADALARLTTAEQERDKLCARLRDIEAVEVPDYRPGAYDREVRARRAAEARVEAAERALAQIRSYRRIPGRGMHSDMEEMRAIARAALACPPQQRGE